MDNILNTDFFVAVFIQRLHATHNLMELLSAKHPGIPPTLRDDRLSEEVNMFCQNNLIQCGIH